MKYKINDSYVVQADSVENAVRLFKGLKTKDSIGKEGYYLTVNRGGQYLAKDRNSSGRQISERNYDEITKEFDLELVDTISTRFGTEWLYRLKAKR